MRSLRQALIGLGIVGFIAGVLSLVVAFSSDHLDQVQVGAVVFYPLIGWSFIGTGLFAWWRRPANRLGALMAAVGFVWFLAALIASDVPGLFAIGGLLNALPFAILLHMLVAFPTGRLETRGERFLVAVAYFDVTVMQLISVLFLDTGDPDVCVGCPTNPLLISDQEVVSGIASGLQTLIAVAGVSAVAVLLYRRWRSASAPAKSALSPVLLTGGLTGILLVISLIGDISGVPRRSGRGRHRPPGGGGYGLRAARVPGRPHALPVVTRRRRERTRRSAWRAGSQAGASRRPCRRAGRPDALAGVLGPRPGSLRGRLGAARGAARAGTGTLPAPMSSTRGTRWR